MADFSMYFSPSAFHDKTMKACREHAIGDFRTDEIPIPKPIGEQLLVKVSACGVCGSDIPRIYSLGTSKQRYPLVIGHEFGGTIVEAGPEADQSLVGKRGAIFPCIPCMKCPSCLSGNYAMCEDYDYLGSRSDGGLAEYCLIPSAWHFVPVNNPNTPGDALGVVEPCVVAQHTLRNAGLKAGQSILIFGAGPIGIMQARWAKIFGASTVIISEVVDEKVEFARERVNDEGILVVNGLKDDVEAALRDANDGKLADITVEATGSAAAFGQAIECSRTFGTVALMGNPARDTVLKLSQHSNILRREITLKGVWNSHYLDDTVNEWAFTVRMIDEGKMRVTDLITHRANLDDVPALTRGIYDRSISICKAIYSEGA